MGDGAEALGEMSPPTSDSNDVALAEAGDYEAFQRLYRRYFSRIYSLCVRLSASHDGGRALTEEVFVRAWAALADLGGETQFDVWLRRLAAEVVIARQGMLGGGVIRSNSSNSVSEGENSAAASPRAGALELSEALAGLQPSARGIFVLHDVEGYQHDEIAEILGITVGASKARLQQARVLLIKALGR